MDYKEAVSRGGGGGEYTALSGLERGPVLLSRKTMLNLPRQFQQYALTTDKHLNCIITNNILSYMFRLQ